ncbi:MAG TPA: xanthine dehydrogenase family protein subunit M, partial [Terriglobales bacterium]|nr:xanthine dehydrogenase family protein subunit M [Terriglobales bacterium]
EFHDPRDLTEALSLLDQYGSDAKILAGGQSLMPLMNLRLARPKILVDINRVRDLSYIDRGNGGGLVVGAVTRQRMVERSALVQERTPLLAAAIPLIGHVQIRNRGTIGGSLVHADPAAELPAVALLLGAEFVLQSLSGQRVTRAGDFFDGYFTTAIEPTEILREIRFPPWKRRSGWAIKEVSRRQGDFALVGIATLLRVDENDACEDARIAVFGAGATAVRIEGAEAALKGTYLHKENLAEAAGIVSEKLDPDSDVHASAEYRREVAGVLTRRALEAAAIKLREANEAWSQDVPSN